MLTPSDIQLFERDKALPQLRRLLTPAVCEQLIASLVPRLDTGSLAVNYLRYKPGINCLAGYTFLVDGVTQHAYAKIFNDAQNDKRDKFCSQAGVSMADDIPFSFFPADSKLPSLSKLDGGVKERGFIARVFSDREDLWPGSLHAIRYKPERRYVARLGIGEENMAVLKMHTRAGYARLRNNNKAFKSRNNLRVAKRIGHSDRHRVLAFEWLPGELASDQLRQGILPEKKLMQVGRALAQIHQQKAKGLLLNDFPSQASQLEAVARQVTYLLPELSNRVATLLTTLNSFLAEQPAVLVPSHGDFYAKQVLLHGDMVHVLDFDESCYDDPMSDLGNFVAHMIRDQQRFDRYPSDLRSFQEALLAGYADAGVAVADQRVSYFAALNLFKLLPHPFRFREADWPAQTACLMDEIAQLLERADGQKLGYTKHSAEHASRPFTSVLPEDARLPFLKEALSPASVLPALTHAIGNYDRGYTLSALHHVQLLRHKPGRRCLIEYAACAKEQSGKLVDLRLLGKARRKKTDRTTYQLMQQLWLGAFNAAAPDGVFVPEPVGEVPAFNMWLQKKVEGYTATGYLQGLTGNAVGKSIAEALYKLQHLGPATDRVHTIEDELAILRERLGEAARQLPAWASRIQLVLDQSVSIAARLPDVKQTPVHRDFYPDNILVSAQGICLLDFDLYCMGDPALDVGNFVGHVMELSLRKYGDPFYTNACAEAFVERYLMLAGESYREAIEIYTTLTLARHIHISTRFDDRKAFTEAILTLCEQRLANHQRIPSFI